MQRSTPTGCDSVEWVNGLSNPIEESYHPNVAGKQGYAAALSPTLVGSAMRVTAAATTQHSGKLAAPQIDLLSAESVAGARKVGISIDELCRLDRELRSGDSCRMTNAGRRIGQAGRLRHGEAGTLTPPVLRLSSRRVHVPVRSMVRMDPCG